jgi:hypothetical protein
VTGEGDPGVVSLRDYIDTMFAEKEKALQAALLAQEKAVSAALNSSDKAITKAEANAEKWRENANEWRGAMSDRDRELPSRREVETLVAGLAARLVIVEARQERIGGKTEAAEKSDVKATHWMIAASGFVVALVATVANLLTG